jgi:hypothetical protein
MKDIQYRRARGIVAQVDDAASVFTTVGKEPGDFVSIVKGMEDPFSGVSVDQIIVLVS